MKLSDFLARAKETAAEMHADTSTSTADLTKLDEAIELLDEYAQDAGALELSIHELPRYVSLYKGNIEQLEGVYEQSAERTRRERFLAAFESPATIERIATVLSELANDAGLEFIPKGTIVVECGFANEVTIRARPSRRRTGHVGNAGGMASPTMQLHLEYWTQFREFLIGLKSPIKVGKPSTDYWKTFPVGRSYFVLVAVNGMRDGYSGVYLSISVNGHVDLPSGGQQSCPQGPLLSG